VGFLLPGGEWPEIFLMFVQFGGLVLLISQLGVASPTETLPQPERPVAPVVGLATPADTKVHLWRTTREYFGYRPRGALLVTVVVGVLQGCTFYTPGGKTFPTLVARLRQSLLAEVIRLSGTPGEELHLG
jgi:p-aminobenzoyl-glutamate transporter AbgT